MSVDDRVSNFFYECFGIVPKHVPDLVDSGRAQALRLRDTGRLAPFR